MSHDNDDHGYIVHALICPIDQSNQDELDFHDHCLPDLADGKLGARIATFSLACIVITFAIVHFIQFRRTTMKVFTDITRVHLATVAMISVFLCGISIFSINLITFVTGQTGANRHPGYLFFSWLSFCTFQVNIGQIVFAMVKIANQQLLKQKDASYRNLHIFMIIFALIWATSMAVVHVVPALYDHTPLSFWLFGISVAGICLLVIATLSTTGYVLHRVRLAARQSRLALSKSQVLRVELRLKILMFLVTFMSPIGILVFLVPLVSDVVAEFQWCVLLVSRTSTCIVCFMAIWLFGFTKSLRMKEMSGSSHQDQSTKNQLSVTTAPVGGVGSSSGGRKSSGRGTDESLELQASNANDEIGANGVEKSSGNNNVNENGTKQDYDKQPKDDNAQQSTSSTTTSVTDIQPQSNSVDGAQDVEGGKSTIIL